MAANQYGISSVHFFFLNIRSLSLSSVLWLQGYLFSFLKWWIWYGFLFVCFLIRNLFTSQADGVKRTNALHPSEPPRLYPASGLGYVFLTSALARGLGHVQAGPQGSGAGRSVALGLTLACPGIMPPWLTSPLSDDIYQLPRVMTELSLTYIPVYHIFIIKTLLFLFAAEPKRMLWLHFFFLGHVLLFSLL